jgi:hypothetical protein
MKGLIKRFIEDQTKYYFYFFSWGYYFFSAGYLSYKKIGSKTTDESIKGIYAYV